MDTDVKVDESITISSTELPLQEKMSSSSSSIPLSATLTKDEFIHNVPMDVLVSMDIDLSKNNEEIKTDLWQQQLETEDRLEMLMKSLSLASSLASMDTESYRRLLYLDIQNEIDSIQKLWQFEETPITSLMNSIHMLQAKIVHLQKESVFEADLVMENLELHQEIEAMKKDRSDAQNVISSFKKKNKKLEDRLSRKRSQVMMLLEYIHQKQIEEINSEELLAMINVSLHEQVMRNKVASSKVKNGFVGNRTRTHTEESALTFKSEFDDSSWSLETFHDETSSESKS